jgi:aryl-alcohol dehydrogenase-like predicted oxidoreductase
MEQRRLGKSNLMVSAMGMGCWAIGGPWTINGNPAGWGVVDDDESIHAIHRAMDLGINFFDTAANYGAGHSERVLGKALAGKRDKVILATKFGYIVNEEQKTVVSDDAVVVKNIQQDCENSLRRLGTAHIDLYQFHVNGFPPDQAAPVRDALEELVSAGKIRCYGWSTDNPAGARVFAQGKHCAVVQHDLNVVQDTPEMLRVCDEFDLASVNRTPLGRGFLTGKYDAGTRFAENDNRSRPGFQKNATAYLDGLATVRAILASNGRTLAQGALAWNWGRSPRTVPIPGIRTVAQAEDNAGALAFGPLTADQMQQIEQLLKR